VSEFLLALTVLFPLSLALLWPITTCRAGVGRLTLFVPLPALALVFVTDEVNLDLPWVLLGARWGLDATGRVLLGLTAVLWLAGGIYARGYLAHDPHRSRFELFWLLTLTGNLGVIIALDMASFLLFYTLMSLAAYGLITHDRQPASLHAGRVYIVLTVIGEVFLFWGMAIAANQTGSLYLENFAAQLATAPGRDIIVGLMILGFGIKLGMMPLHTWLPLAHPAAPTPASAVLSGAIIKAGLLGLLRFLPWGAIEMPAWGAVCLVIGIASALIAALIGLTQDNPKTVLAYSSVSQMGLVTMGLGAGLLAPSAWPLISTAILLFALHHAVAKGALFLGVGVAQAELPAHWQRWMVIVGLIVPALALAGLPLTTGYVVKNALKEVAAQTPEFWATTLAWVLPLTSVTTTLLVARFLFVVWPHGREAHHRLTLAMTLPWGILVVGVVALAFVTPPGELAKRSWFAWKFDKVWAALWPMLLASVALLACAFAPLRHALRRIHIPPGDLVVPATALVLACRQLWNAIVVRGFTTLVAKTLPRLQRDRTRFARSTIIYVSRGLENELATGILIGLVSVVMFLLLVW
jgi:formate hydrogenlyase subunit 3/multisubunit Na+/H+ antiporter MnhD subunit